MQTFLISKGGGGLAITTKLCTLHKLQPSNSYKEKVILGQTKYTTKISTSVTGVLIRKLPGLEIKARACGAVQINCGVYSTTRVHIYYPITAVWIGDICLLLYLCYRYHSARTETAESFLEVTHVWSDNLGLVG